MATCMKSVLRRHPAYVTHHALLADSGVRFLPPEEVLHRDPDGVVTFDLTALRAALPS
ncbi:hypothetical protein [Saccharopolyspora sp. 7B]|uniref:hypothetical protein n=1 Tax=Saccharopolyspora sp. 7B TaxID=2877240 RepID=UPI001CD7847C|nr:hypothetical protein [Saccharopolyspora sp. 7B]MCA1282513.1 hypothetical protein [Saccharopolyspora sp. 7B]